MKAWFVSHLRNANRIRTLGFLPTVLTIDLPRGHDDRSTLYPHSGKGFCLEQALAFEGRRPRSRVKNIIPDLNSLHSTIANLNLLGLGLLKDPAPKAPVPSRNGSCVDVFGQGTRTVVECLGYLSRVHMRCGRGLWLSHGSRRVGSPSSPKVLLRRSGFRSLLLERETPSLEWVLVGTRRGDRVHTYDSRPQLTPVI